MAKNSKTTSKTIASLASKTLQNPNASNIAKELAGSALSQVNKGNQTEADLENKASKVLSSDKYSEETKQLAASILSQSNKER
ncbi:hypothetical protein HIO71_03210 [Chryseobacterium aquaticum]|uniref:Uncharacterized protein n=1 Tax=Chryseobacterium aquaticum TaxID=452084 RepID=A0A848N796_9FLAO|nr:MULTISPECIES: hypothetical protein [Chryseobacterium]NMR33213.1 hypothetical protein [Chryseobacterium aquaticum]NRQ44855.1 hypothetical protein [Chryseobacterium sp. C-204]